MIIDDGGVKSTASERCLHFCLNVIRNCIPSFLSENSLLSFVYSETRAGNGELNDEQTKENDHVEEEGDLVMFSRSI